MKKQLLLIGCILLTIIGCRKELKEINYNFSVALQDSVFNDVAVGTEVSTPIIFAQKLEQPQYTATFSYQEELGTILFSEREVKNGEQVEILDVKNLRLGYRSTAVGKDTIHIKVANAMVQQELTMIVQSIARTGVTFPSYSFYESYSPNIPVTPTPTLTINNPSDNANAYRIFFERTEGDDLQAWLIDGEEKREMRDRQEMNLFSGVDVKSYRFEFLCNKPGTQKFRLVVLDKYGNRFESPEYMISFEVKGKVEFPVFNFSDTYSPNKKFRAQGTLKLHNLTDKENVYKIMYKGKNSEGLDIDLVYDDNVYQISKMNEVSLIPKTGEISCFFDLQCETQGTKKFSFEVVDKYGNRFESPEYMIVFKANAMVTYPTIPEESYQTNVNNYAKGGRLEVQGIDDPKNEFWVTYEVLNGDPREFFLHLAINSNEMIMLREKEKQSIARGTEHSSYQFMFKQRKVGTTEFRVTVEDKYGNKYQQTYRVTFKDRYYAKVELTMTRVDRLILLDIDDVSGSARQPGWSGLLKRSGVGEVNGLKSFLADGKAMREKLENKPSERYIYSVTTKVYSDPEMTKIVKDILTVEDDINMVITAPSEVYNLDIFKEEYMGQKRYKRKGKFVGGTSNELSVTVAPFEKVTSMIPKSNVSIVGDIDMSYIRVMRNLDNVINYKINKNYRLAPNQNSESTMGTYPLGIFFGEIIGLRSMGFAKPTHKDLELVPSVEIYKCDSYGGKPYYLKTIKASIAH